MKNPLVKRYRISVIGKQNGDLIYLDMGKYR